MEEPKMKKRRTQSNPLRYHTTHVMPMLESEECNPIIEESRKEVLDLQNKVACKSEDSPVVALHVKRHRCSDSFETKDALRIHVEDEDNVQKELERQLQQQSYNKTSSGINREGRSETAKVNSPKSCREFSLQSNPLRYHTTPVMPMLESEECNLIIEEPRNEVLDLQNKVECKSEDSPVVALYVKRHRFSDSFETKDALRIHVEDEDNVQKELERELQQQSYNKTSSGINREGSSETAKVNSPKSCREFSLQQIVPIDLTRNSPSDGLMHENRDYKSPRFPPIPPSIPFSRHDESKPGNISVPSSMFPIPMMPSSSNEHSSPPPLQIQTCSGDEDGNSSGNQNRSPPISCENSTMEELKMKKRRKQSNPLIYQTPVMPLLESEECNPIIEEPSDKVLDLRNKVESKSEVVTVCVKCRNCSDSLETKEAFRVHVDDKHKVQKELERQIHQQSYNKTTLGINKKGNNPSDGLMNENRDYKSRHFPFPPIPPSIPFSRPDESMTGNMSVPPFMFQNPTVSFPVNPPISPFFPFSRPDESMTGNMFIPLSKFPNPMMPFSVIPQGQTPPVSNGSSHSGKCADDYCELCNKEFSNKSNLKKRKANIHGIYSGESIDSTPYGNPFLSLSWNNPIPLPHMLQISTAEQLPTRTGMSNVLKTYCEICQIYFYDKYYLKKHRQSQHRIIDPE